MPILSKLEAVCTFCRRQESVAPTGNRVQSLPAHVLITLHICNNLSARYGVFLRILASQFATITCDSKPVVLRSVNINFDDTTLINFQCTTPLTFGQSQLLV